MGNTYTVTLTFEGLNADNPLEAVNIIESWIKEGSERMIYNVLDEKTKEHFSVDLNEDDEDVVLKLPKVDPTQTIYVTDVCTTDKKEWQQLVDDMGNPFTSISDAIEYVRKNPDVFPYGTGLSTYRQTLYDNAEWDNL
jgi:hypothetical protein